MIAALVAEHEHHALARRHLSATGRIPAIVLAETYAQLRRTFGQPARTAAAVLRTWMGDSERVLPTSSAAVTSAFARAAELNLGGNIHDALIAIVCSENDVGLVTLDGRQHQLALALGARSTYLLA